MINDPLIHVPLYLDEWQSKLSALDYNQRGAFITLYINYVKTNGTMTLSKDNTALFRACGALTSEEQESLIELFPEVKNFADPRIKKQVALRQTRRELGKKGGVAKAKAKGLPIAKPKAKAKGGSKLELELESEREKESDNLRDTTISKVSSGSGEAEHFLGIPIDELFSDEGS